MKRDQDLMEFPCRFPIKIMGRTGEDLPGRVREVAEGLVARPEEMECSQRGSREGNFIAVTLTVTATSREELDALYRALGDMDESLMVL